MTICQKLVCGGGSLANPIDNTDTPFANLSSEAPDVEDFFGFNWGLPGLIPPIGTDWDIPRTPAWCVSPISQIDADLCANNRQTPGTINGGTNGDRGNGWGPPGGPHTGYAFNQSQTCSFICPDGNPYTFTVSAGTFSALNVEAANAMAYSWACRFAYNNRVCFGTFARYGCVNQPYNSSMTIDNANGPYTVTIESGSIPTGLTPSSSPSVMFLKGTPTVPGDFVFTVKAVDRNGNSSTKTFTISIIGITNGSAITHPVEGRAYTYILQSSGGTAPYTYVVVSGTLPTNLTLSTAGTISGTPDYMVAGDFSVTVKVTDVGGNSCSQAITLTVDPAPGPDWTKFTWPFVNNNGALGSSASASGIGRQAQAAVSSVGNIPFPDCEVNTNTILYTGPNVTARVRITVAASGTLVPPAGNTLTCRLWRNGVQIGVYGSGFASGTQSFDIPIVGGVGVAFFIDAPVGAPWAALSGVGNVASISMTFQIFNL